MSATETTPANRTRFRMTTSEEIYIDVGPETAARLMAAINGSGDYMAVYEFAPRVQRIAHHDPGFVRSDVSVVPDDYEPWPDDVQPVDEAMPEQYVWCARHFIGQARCELISARYRQGDVALIDSITSDLARIEERVRQLALVSDGREDTAAVHAARRAAAGDALEDIGKGMG